MTSFRSLFSISLFPCNFTLFLPKLLSQQFANSITGGKAAWAFLNVLSEYCITKSHPPSADEEVTQWFKIIEEILDVSMDEAFKVLEASYYSGYWGDYAFDEREFFIKRTQLEVSQWQYELSIQSAEQRWQAIQIILDKVQQLLHVFKQHNLPKKTWYNPKDTIPDFERLEIALQILQKRGCSQVRIQFT